jgi:AbrB family looped-hinge helix DNA binding protein
MNTVTVSSKYQVVIPKEIREAVGIVPGQKLGVVAVGKQLKVVQLRGIEELRGFCKGMDTTIERDPHRF